MEENEFLKLAVHEVKTPISVIHGFADLINCDIISEDNIKDATKKIQIQTQRMTRFVDEIAYYVGTKYAMLDVKFEDADLRIILENTAEAVREKANGNVDISIRGNGKVKGDISLLKTMFLHIMENGIIYNDSHNKRLVCDISNEEESLVVSIEDNGTGIEQKERKAVFECFYRVDKLLSREKGGNGLGLSVCRNIANIHNAQICLYSILGKGTKVTVRF